MYSKSVEVRDPATGSRFVSDMEFFDCATELYEVTRDRPILYCDDRLNTYDLPASYCGGISSVEEAIRMLYEGWEDKVPEARLMLDEIQNTIPKAKRSFQNSPVGFAPVVPLAIMGVPNCMITDVRKPVKSRIIEIHYDFGAPSTTSAEALMWAGMRTIAEIIRLEKQGYRIRLYASHWQAEGSHGDAAIVKLKSEYAPLDLKRLMFPMFHPGYFRIIHFGWYDRCPTEKYLSDGGNSLYMFYQRWEDLIVERCLGPNAIFISAKRMIDMRWNESKVDDYLKRRFERIGVKTKTP